MWMKVFLNKRNIAWENELELCENFPISSPVYAALGLATLHRSLRMEYSFEALVYF